MEWLYCVCDQEFCWCSEKVPVTEAEIETALLESGSAPEKACEKCADGLHLWSPFSGRTAVN